MKTATIFFLGAVTGVIVHKALYKAPTNPYPTKDITPTPHIIRGVGGNLYEFEVREKVLFLWKNRQYWYIQKEKVALASYPSRLQVQCKGAIDTLFNHYQSEGMASAQRLYGDAIEYAEQTNSRKGEALNSYLGSKLIKHYANELGIDLSTGKGQQTAIFGN
jgi:hypothetical protein